jgi:O-antigen ligase
MTKGEDLVKQDTLIDRIIENRYAYKKIRSHPVFGIGLGNNYRNDVQWNQKLNSYIHNGFLWILMKIGIFGFAAFLWFLIASVVRGFKNWNKIDNSFLKGAYIGFTLACIGFMLSALVNPVFMQWHSSPVIGIMLGSNELINRLNSQGT